MLLCRATNHDLDDDAHTCTQTTGHRDDHECRCGWVWADPDERQTR